MIWNAPAKILVMVMVLVLNGIHTYIAQTMCIYWWNAPAEILVMLYGFSTDPGDGFSTGLHAGDGLVVLICGDIIVALEIVLVRVWSTFLCRVCRCLYEMSPDFRRNVD